MRILPLCISVIYMISNHDSNKKRFFAIYYNILSFCILKITQITVLLTAVAVKQRNIFRHFTVFLLVFWTIISIVNIHIQLLSTQGSLY